MKYFIQVDPRNTSQMCSGCGTIVKKDLSVRVHNCPECGLVLNRDHNAAINILDKGVVALGLANEAGCGKRSTRNIALEAIPKRDTTLDGECLNKWPRKC